MDKSDWFCNEWECPYRKNKKYKEPTLCDLVWDECPVDDEYYLKRKGLKNDKNN